MWRARIDPARDIETINLELIFSDMEIVERRIDKAAKAAKGDKKSWHEVELLQTASRRTWRRASPPAASSFADEDESHHRRHAALLCLQAHHLRRQHERGRLLRQLDEQRLLPARSRQIADAEDAAGAARSAPSLEEEIADMSEEDKMMFLEELGLKESGLDRLIKAGYHLLGLISYLTAGKHGGPRLDHHPRHQGAAGRRQDPHRL